MQLVFLVQCQVVHEENINALKKQQIVNKNPLAIVDTDDPETIRHKLQLLGELGT